MDNASQLDRAHRRAACAFLFCALSLLLLAGCGGGGGGGGGGSSVPPPGPPQENSDEREQPQTPPGESDSEQEQPSAPSPGPSPQPAPPDPVTPDPPPDPPQAQPPAPPPADLDTRRQAFSQSREFQNQPALALVKADYAYARGATGEGVTVGLLDGAVFRGHPKFAGMDSSGEKLNYRHSDGYTPRIETCNLILSVNTCEYLHGTAVAGIMAANRNSDATGADGGMHGVAFDARIRAVGVETVSALRAGLKELADPGIVAINISQTIPFFGTFVVPLHLLIPHAARQILLELNGVGSAMADAVRQDVPLADRTILVWAVGNDGERSPASTAGLPYFYPEVKPHSLAVVSVNAGTGRIAATSNRCGSHAASWCLAAPGEGLLVPRALIEINALDRGSDAFTDLGGRGGSSFAAPFVTGALALLKQHFRDQLGHHELAARLLATADKTGPYADTDIYGQGLLDLDAATRPVGVMMSSLPGDPDSLPLADSGIELSGGAFGQTLQHQLAGVEMASFDELGAPFFHSAAGWATPAAAPARRGRGGTGETSLPVQSRQPGGARLSLTVDSGGAVTGGRYAAGNWWLSYGRHGGASMGLYDENEFGGGANDNPVSAWNTDAPPRTEIPAARRFSDPLAFAAPYLSLLRDGPAGGWSGELGGGRFGFALMHGAPQYDGWRNPGGARGLGALLEYHPRGTGLWLQAGAVREADGFLGARARGVLGEARGTTAFAGINGAWDLGGGYGGNFDDYHSGNWRVLASAYFGRTRTEVESNGLLREADAVDSSAFGIGLARTSLWRRNDWFGVRLSQPLRAESGVVTLRLPAGRTRYGEVVHRDHHLRLSPAGRHLELEAAYHLPLAGGTLTTGLGMERHPQHDDTRNAQVSMRLSFTRRF